MDCGCRRGECGESCKAGAGAASRGISVVGKEPRQAHAVKLGGNFLISAMIHSLSESFVFADGQGINPEMFAETINSALFQSPFFRGVLQVDVASAGASRGHD